MEAATAAAKMKKLFVDVKSTRLESNQAVN